MKNFFKYLSAFLLGALLMALAALKWFVGVDNTYQIDRLKQKNVRGDATMIPVIDKKSGVKQTWKERREERKAARKLRRNEK